MISRQSYLKIIDNSGAKRIMCIGILGTHKKYGKIGDIIIGVVKNTRVYSTIKYSTIVKALIVRTKKPLKRDDGSLIRFSDNAAILISTEKNPKASRVFGPIVREIRKKKLIKIIALAENIL